MTPPCRSSRIALIPRVSWCGRVRGERWCVASEPCMKSADASHGSSPSQLIDARIDELGDWRGEMLKRIRALIREADPDVIEEWKWRGVPVWSHDGLICTGETYKNVVKMTFV